MDGEKDSTKNYGCNILVTPSMAWYTKEALEEDTRIWVESVVSLIDGKPINVVN